MSQLALDTPIDRLAPRMATGDHFQRHHFAQPRLELGSWRVRIEGAANLRAFTLDELRTFPQRELSVVLECAGHRRAEFRPQAAGIPWRTGAVSEARWGGTPLRDVLNHVGIGAARFVVFEGADAGRLRQGVTAPFARALPLARALHPDTLLAWEMNDEPLPVEHGAPLRLVVPGWYATDSVKWLCRISLAYEPFAGPFEIEHYRLNGRRMTTLPVHALLTSHTARDRLHAGGHLLKGVAWGGSGGIAAVEISTDGERWRQAHLVRPTSTYGFVRWRLHWQAMPGTATLRVRATDGAGRTQPETPVWNDGGYANASWHRVDLAIDQSSPVGVERR